MGCECCKHDEIGAYPWVPHHVSESRIMKYRGGFYFAVRIQGEDGPWFPINNCPWCGRSLEEDL